MSQLRQKFKKILFNEGKSPTVDELFPVKEANNPDFMVDMNSKGVKIPAQIRKKANRAIGDIVDKIYHRAIPIDKIEGALNKLFLYMVQEDGTPWSGMFLGAEGRANIRLAYESMPDKYELVNNAMLVLTWYKMDHSGKYEVVAYVS